MEWNKRNIKIIVGLIAFALIAWAGLQNYNTVLDKIGWCFNLFLPFILGGCMAFIINLPMKGIENQILSDKHIKGNKHLIHARRPISVVLALLAIFLILVIVCLLVIPEFARSIVSIKDKAPAFFSQVQEWLLILEKRFPEIKAFIGNYTVDWTSIENIAIGFAKKSAVNVLGSTMNAASSVFGGIMNFVIGLIFAIYILGEKEKLGNQFCKVMYAYLPKKRVDTIVEIIHLSGKTFGNFITGQCTEAVIIIVLYFVSMTIFRLPYALMIAVLIGVLSLIPVFGTFVGCFLGAFLLLMNRPIDAIWFVILFIVIQQIEGNLIYPRVVGGSVGLPAIWVLVAVTVGGSAWGITGMILTIPLCSIVYTLLRESVNNKLLQKGIE